MYTEYYNIVESVKKGYGLGTNFQEILDESGTARFYAFNTSCHDQPYTVKGSLVNFGYQSLLAPFIPIFFMGEEFNNPLYGNSTAFLTPLQLDLLEQPENRAFYESVKEIIRIRRTYPEIFNYFPQNHRESNICEVEVVGLETLTGLRPVHGRQGHPGGPQQQRPRYHQPLHHPHSLRRHGHPGKRGVQGDRPAHRQRNRPGRSHLPV